MQVAVSPVLGSSIQLLVALDTGLTGPGHPFRSSVPYNHLFVTTSEFLQTLESTVSHQAFYSLGQEEIPAKAKLKYFSVSLREKKVFGKIL